MSSSPLPFTKLLLQATHPHWGAPGLHPWLLSTLGALQIFWATVSHSAALSPRCICAVRPTASTRARFPRPLLDAVQKSDQQDVTWKLLNSRANESPALGTSEFISGTYDPQQTPFAKRMLARQDLCRSIKPLQTHRTLQKIQQGRLIHLYLVYWGKASEMFIVVFSS